MKKSVIFLLIFICALVNAQTVTVNSPDSKIVVSV